MKIAIGADKYGYELKESIKSYLQQIEIDVQDYGAQTQDDEIPYYEVASNVGRKVSTGSFTRAILVCGTGMGMSIIANKQPGVYAAVCENVTAATRARSINNSNVLTLGGFVTQPETAKEIVDAWLKTGFTEGWEEPIARWLEDARVKIEEIENYSFGNQGK